MPSTESKRGRRTLAYSATADADQYFPKAYGELTNELLGYVADRDPELLEDLFAKRRQHRIDNAQTRLAGKRTLGAKVAELTRILDEDGYLATYEKVTPGVYRVIEHNCAIWAVAQRYGQACTSEIDFIRAALPEAEIERIQHMVAGARPLRVRDQSPRRSRVSVSASPVAILGRQPLGDERAVARLGIALDTEQRGRRIGGHLGDDRREVDMIEDLPEVAVPILRRQLAPGALADTEAVVLGVLHVAELGGRRQLLVVAVPDAGVGERGLEPQRVRPRVFGAPTPRRWRTSSTRPTSAARRVSRNVSTVKPYTPIVATDGPLMRRTGSVGTSSRSTCHARSGTRR